MDACAAPRRTLRTMGIAFIAPPPRAVSAVPSDRAGELDIAQPIGGVADAEG
jgi:hypothetical protein